MKLKAQQYKDLSIKEFTKAADRYETSSAGIYYMCKNDYPEILEEIKSEDFNTLLDAGCGPAPMLTLLTRELPDKHYVGIDLTPRMIEIAKSKQLKNTELYIGDCENLPFDEDSFDIIICSNSFHHYPRPQDFFRGVEKCLKPGGRLILRDFGSSSKFVQWFVTKIEMPLVNKLGHGDVGMSTRREVECMCQEAGLIIEKFEYRKSFRLHCVARKKLQ